MIRRRAALAAGLLAFGAALGLTVPWHRLLSPHRPPGRTSSEPLGGPDRAGSLSVAFSGCERIVAGPVCHVAPDRALHLWVPGGRPDDLEVHIDGAPVAAETATAAAGLRVRLPSPKPGRLDVRDRDRGTWKLALEPARVPPQLEQARRWAAERDADALKRVEPDSPRVAVEVRLMLARLAGRQGDFRTAFEHRAEAARLADAAGEWSLLARARFAQAYALTLDLVDLDAAQRELRRLDGLADRVPEVSAYRPYYRALARLEASDLAAAARDLRASEQRARELGLETLARSVEERRAAIDLDLGDFDAAAARLRDLLEWARSRGDPCVESVMATNLGWALLLRQRHRPEAAPSPEPVLRRALALSTGPCASEREAANARVNLAFAALQSGAIDRAARWLGAVRPEHLHAKARFDWMEMEARVALSRRALGESSAWADRLLLRARVSARPSKLFRAHVLEADVLEARGHARDARRARQRAENVLDQVAVQVPLVGARHAFLAARDDNVRELTRLLLNEGRAAAALDVIRRARSRSLGRARISQALARLGPTDRDRWDALIGEYRKLRRALDRDIEADWSRARSQLEAARARRTAQRARLESLLTEALDLLPSAAVEPEPKQSILRLAWIHLEAKTVVIGRRGSDAFATAWDDASSRLPEAAVRRLDASRVVHLHPYGALANRDLHMLTAGGVPLAERIPTVYALDLTDERPDERLRSALVVVDPNGDLETGPEERRLVVSALEQDELHVSSVDDLATRLEALRPRIARADWFHFGGHGQWSPDDPMAGGLALAEGTQLGIGDILTLRRAPAVVVLTSCEAGRPAGRGGESVGIAHAFAIAGARFVVAPSREVRDDLAHRFAHAFYRAAGSVLERYREAISALGPESAPFRVFVP